MHRRAVNIMLDHLGIRIWWYTQTSYSISPRNCYVLGVLLLIPIPVSFCEEASVSFIFLISLKDKKAIFPQKEKQTLVQFLGVQQDHSWNFMKNENLNSWP